MANLIAEAFFSDPRVQQAKALLLQALADHQKSLTGIRLPDPQAAQSYADLLQQFATARAGALYYPYLGSGIGHGPLVELADSSVKYDMISGIGVHYLGHSHSALLAAGIDAALRDTVMQGNLQQNVESARLSQTLLNFAQRDGRGPRHCFLTTSGAMANENALKLVLQKNSPAARILAFEHGFAGRTLALAQITDKPAYRVGLPTVLAVDYVPFFNPADPQGSTQRAVNVLKHHLTRYPKQHAAMWMELVLGEGGYYPGDQSFFIALMDVLKTAGVAIWADEIQTFGRTTCPFAFQHFNLDAYIDVVTIGKLTQVCATLFTDAYAPKPGLLSQTFTGSTAAIFAAQAILDAMQKQDLFGPKGKIARLHAHFAGRLAEISQRHPDRLTGPFGIGAMVACTIFGGNADKTKTFLRALFDAGVIAFVAGDDPARVRFLMPVGAVEPSDIDTVCTLVEQTLAQVAAR